jgi:RND family efflux transporter MFP subunit
LLNTISSDDPISADVAVDQSLIPFFVKILNKGTVQNDSTFTLQLSDSTVYPKPGHILLIDRAVDPQTGTIRARIVFPNADKLLKVGLTCNIRVKNASANNTLLIPYKAVTEQLGEYFVFLVHDTIALQRKILLGNKINGNVIVRSGLEAGDKIVVNGMQKLKDSAAIQVGPPKAPPATAPK